MTGGETRVIDTNVAIGLTLKRHTHHEKSWDYVVGWSGTVYLPPTAGDEFDELKPDIEDEMSKQLSEHQSKALAKYGNREKLTRDDLRDIKRDFVDDDWDVAEFLYEYYDNLISEFEVSPRRIEFDVGDMVSGVGDDPCSDYGGWQNVIERWTRGIDSYSSLKSNLLIYEGKDPTICVEAHHIATERDGRTELGSADGDFLDHKEGEPKSRRDDIRDKTALCGVADLRPEDE